MPSSQEPAAHCPSRKGGQRRLGSSCAVVRYHVWLLRIRYLQNEQMYRPSVCTLTQKLTFPLDFEVPYSKGLDLKPWKLPCCHCRHKSLFIARHTRDRRML
ncbi:TPA: hypothetical protein ACH3X1_012178 [Trebouxia sp. C0004]